MRHLTLFLLGVPSFLGGLAAHNAIAQDAQATEEKYRKLATWQVCMKGCETGSLQQLSSGVPNDRAVRKLSACKLTCNDDLNRVDKSRVDQAKSTTE
jgi:hypothetical protein